MGLLRSFYRIQSFWSTNTIGRSSYNPWSQLLFQEIGTPLYRDDIRSLLKATELYIRRFSFDSYNPSTVERYMKLCLEVGSYGN